MLIGFCGHIKAGKTEAANQLATTDFAAPFSFATALRALAERSTRLPEITFTTQKDEIIPQYGITGRELLVRLGNFWRGIDPYFWVDKLDATLPTETYDTDKRITDFSVDDVRYPNEAELIRRRGGYLVRIIRPGFEPARLDETEFVAAGLVADYEIIAVTKTELADKVFALVGALRGLEVFKHGVTQRHRTGSDGRLPATERVPAPPPTRDTAVGQGEPGGTSGISGIPATLRAGSYAVDAAESLPEHEHGATRGTIPVSEPTAKRTQRKPAHERAVTEPLLQRKGGDIMKLPCGPTDITWKEVQEGYGNHIPFENFKSGTNECLKCGHVWGHQNEPEEDIIVPHDEVP